MKHRFPPGNKLGGRPPGAKNRTTLLREERRAMFDERISQKWEEIIDKLRPEYIADQYLGKAPTKVDLTTKIEKMDPESEEALLAAEKTYLETLHAARDSKDA